jgi:hypothetical protein
VRIVPCTISRARAHVALHHRHLPRVTGGLFAVGVADASGTLRGVAIVGRPSARMLDDDACWLCGAPGTLLPGESVCRRCEREPWWRP